MEDLTEDERNRLKLGLTVPSNLRQPFDLGQAVRSLNSQGAVRGFQYNLFQLAEYYNDGIFNIMKLPKGVSLYHGSYNLANYLVFMPLGRTYFDTLYANGPSLQNLLDNGIVFQKSEKFWEEISSYGNPAPAWLSFLSTANLYSMDRAGELGRPVDCNDNKVVDLGGENLEVKKCVLAFETQNLNASFFASFKVPVPEVTGFIFAPKSCIRWTLGFCLSISIAPIKTSHSNPNNAQAVAVATPC